MLEAQSASSSNAGIRREVLNGTEYLVAPVIAVREGVYMYPRTNGRGIRREFLPSDEIANTADQWEDVPLTLSHPKDSDGIPGLISDSRTNETIVGEFRNIQMKSNSLGGETWIKADEVGEHDGKLESYVNSVKQGRPQEVSTGYQSATEFERGKYNSKQYTYVQREPDPDHLALLTEERGNCSVSEGCGVGQVLNQAPESIEDGVRVNQRRLKSNMTPEQADIVEDIVQQFIQSQGNASLEEFRMWIEQNDDLDADDVTAVHAAFSELLNRTPNDWDIEGEFTAWLDHRREQARENTIDDISESSGQTIVDDGSHESDAISDLVRNLYEKLNLSSSKDSADEPTGDIGGSEREERSSNTTEQTMKNEKKEKLMEFGLSEEVVDALEGTECMNNILNWAEEAHSDADSEGSESTVNEDTVSEIRSDLRSEFEDRFNEQQETIEELKSQIEADRRQEEEKVNEELQENSELGEETIETMELEAKREVANELTPDESEEDEEARSNFAGIPGDVDFDYETDESEEIPAGGRSNYERYNSEGE